MCIIGQKSKIKRTESNLILKSPKAGLLNRHIENDLIFSSFNIISCSYSIRAASGNCDDTLWHAASLVLPEKCTFNTYAPRRLVRVRTHTFLRSLLILPLPVCEACGRP